MRRSPLRRTGFKRHEPSAEREPKPLSKATRPASYSGGVSGEPINKRPAIRSEKLLAAVRLLPCQHSGREGMTQPAHSNWPQHGKSGARKADDNRVAALSAIWHHEIDQGSRLSADERQRIWWEAHCKTVRELLARGLWPAGVPVPQLEDFWA